MTRTVRFLLTLCLALPPALGAQPASAAELFRVDFSGGRAALARALPTAPAGQDAQRRERMAAPLRFLAGVFADGPSFFALVDLEPGAGRVPSRPAALYGTAAPVDRATADALGLELFPVGNLRYLCAAHDRDRFLALVRASPASFLPRAPREGAFASGFVSLAPVASLLGEALDGARRDAASVEPPCLLRMRRFARLAALGAGGTMERERAKLRGRCPQGAANYVCEVRDGRERLLCPAHGSADAFDREGFDPLALLAEEFRLLETVAALWSHVGDLSFALAERDGALELALELPFDLVRMRRVAFLKGGDDPFALLAGPAMDAELAATVPERAASYFALRLPPLAPALLAHLSDLASGVPAHAPGDGPAALLLHLLRPEPGDPPGGLLPSLAPGVVWFSRDDETEASGEGVVVLRVADRTALPAFERRIASRVLTAPGYAESSVCGYRFYTAGDGAAGASRGVREFGLLDDRLVVSLVGGGVRRVAERLCGETGAHADAGEIAQAALAMRVGDAGPLVRDLTSGAFAAWDRPLEIRVRREGRALVARFALPNGGDAE